jgi:chorismate dehydratase
LVDRKIRVGAVSYLNTKPFIYGLENGPIKDEIDLMVDYPARLVTMLKNGQIDIGLVPVGALPGLGEYHIVTDYCIGTEGEVASVAVFSEVPMDEIENVYLDYQSRTSVLLCKLLFEKHWKKQVNFIEATDESYIQEIKGKTAGLIIGDRALMNRSRFPYIYDLGLGWKEMTGLPFVFAVWIAIKEIHKPFLVDFSKGMKCGLLNLDEIISAYSISEYSLSKYYTQNISYDLNEQKKESITYFLGLNS